LCFLAGANSIFLGDELLTAGNPGVDEDMALMATLKLDGQAQAEAAPS
jgi:biotin synthase